MVAELAHFALTMIACDTDILRDFDANLEEG
jgi:hypothetical protein